MIDTVSNLLSKLIEEENRRLRDYRLSHSPTIGDMYEGLTKDVINRAIPPKIGLNVVSGFITDDTGALSLQIDCMLVRGSGEQIPYTDKYKWHIKNVIAVFEIKKTLYSNALADSYVKLRTVLDNLGRHLTGSDGSETFDISSACRAFEQITGLAAPEHKNAASLPFETEMIYHTLIIERISPIRVALGYDGFASEVTFREAFYAFLENNLGKHGFGPLSLPQLFISGAFSLVKINGQPYVSPLREGWWPILCSTRVNPVRLLLEFIWTRLERDFGVAGLWGEDLQKEGMNCCLLARAVRTADRHGWQFEYVPATEPGLSQLPDMVDWEPTVVDEHQFVIFSCLCSGKIVQTTDLLFTSYLAKRGIEMAQFIAGLLSTGHVAVDGDRLKLTTEGMGCVILPDGRCVVGENNTGRLSRWVQRYMESRSV